MADREVTWVAPDGTTVPFDASTGICLRRGMSGRYMPPVEHVTDDVAGLDGAQVRKTRYAARDVTIPVTVTGAGYQSTLRYLASKLDPERPGRLRVGDRQLVARYAEGLEVDEAEGLFDRHRPAVLVFTAHDPMWEDVTATTVIADAGGDAFLSPDADTPWFTWRIAADEAVGSFLIDNDGDRYAWPRWTIQGPGGSVTLENRTTGERIELDVALDAGERVEVDTRPGRKTIIGPDGGNLWPDASDDTTLWPLQTGSQTVEVVMPDAEPGETNVRLEYRRRWLTV